MTGIVCDTSKDQEYDSKDGCGAGDDVWTGDSSDDQETGEAARCNGNDNGEVIPGCVKDRQIRNEDIRWTLKVDRFGRRSDS